MNWNNISIIKPSTEEAGETFLCRIETPTDFIYKVYEWFDPCLDDEVCFFLTEHKDFKYHITHWCRILKF